MKWTRPNQSKLDSQKSVIYAELQGGLGNQLFQFANGVARSLYLNTPLQLDDRMLIHDSLREYSLQPWELVPRVKYQIVLRNEGLQFIEIPGSNSANIQIIEEQSFHFTEINEQLRQGNSYRFVGYWQSALNFSPYQSELKKYLKGALISKNSDSRTSMHIRRGDFVNNPKTLAYHGILDFEYYFSAISLLDASTDVIDVISDGFDEIQELIGQLEIATGKIFNLRTDLKDEILALSALASSAQIIIANSSFSWWAAYLSDAKKVIAPRKYFSEKTLRLLNISDLYPAGWVLI